MSNYTVSIAIDTDRLTTITDGYLASLWHVAQANPADISDRAAGDLAESIGREIIRRFLANTPPELWAHQGRHADWVALQLPDKMMAHEQLQRMANRADFLATVVTGPEGQSTLESDRAQSIADQLRELAKAIPGKDQASTDVAALAVPEVPHG